MTPSRLRSVAPLVVLSATTLVLAIVKASALRGRVDARAYETTAVASAGNDRPVASSAEPPLAADFPLGDGGVVAEAARTLHSDGARTHRAKGRAPRAPHERWRAKVEGPIVSQVVLAPDERTAYVTSLDGSLTAIGRLGEQPGKVRFRVPLGDRAYATPLVGADGTVYVGSDAKKLFAVGANGAVAWRLDLDGEADTAPVALTGDRIAFAAGATLYVVSTRGDVRARFRAKKKIFTAPAVATDGTIYFGSQDHRAYAITGDGVLKWAIDLGADVDGGPTIADDGAIVFGTDAGRVVRLEPQRGDVIWSRELGGYVRGALTVARDGAVLTGTYGPTPALFRLRGNDGHTLGVFRIAGTGSRDFGIHGGPLEDDEGTLVFGTEGDEVCAIERTGRVRFRIPRASDVDAPVTLASDGALLVGADDGTVVELAD